MINYRCFVKRPDEDEAPVGGVRIHSDQRIGVVSGSRSMCKAVAGADGVIAKPEESLVRLVGGLIYSQ